MIATRIACVALALFSYAHAWQDEISALEAEILSTDKYKKRDCFIQDLYDSPKSQNGYIVIYSDDYMVAIWCDNLQSFDYKEEEKK